MTNTILLKITAITSLTAIRSHFIIAGKLLLARTLIYTSLG